MKSQSYVLSVTTARGTNRKQCRSIFRFRKMLKELTWSSQVKRVYVRVSYGAQKDKSGITNTITNFGTYENEHDFKKAVSAFLEH